ncbi:TlpA disulfide reductase family protein [uncultured Lacinutrix sp.]|uniref:TlpA family protein disulfide reductase n=1 Tax=uncultured Lacinutrix sp. TaxID=574032 RepID=UPI0026353035|nr:TlpA disulfide reductase family protein [uncultured Lacinutrix sp.]
MSYLKSIFLLCALLFSTIGISQDYKFIPEDQERLTDDQVKTLQIMITPDVLLFNEKGKILPMSNMELMANPDYKPLFYANDEGKIKSVIFQKKSNHPVLIKKNPEADFAKGEKALDFIVTDLEGNTIKLSELKDKVVVLNFWFTKCGPCVVEMPKLNELVKEYEDKDVVFLAITFNKEGIVENFLYETDFNYTIVPNANDVINMYGVQSYPTSIVINKKGEIVLKEIGYRTNIKSVLSKAIKNQLK